MQGKPHPGEDGPTQTIFKFHGGHDCCGSADWELPASVPDNFSHTIDETKWAKVKTELEKASKELFFTECEVTSCSPCLCFLVCCMLHNEEAKRGMEDRCKDVAKYQLKGTGLIIDFIDWEKDGKKGDSVVFRHPAKASAAPKEPAPDTAPGAAN